MSASVRRRDQPEKARKSGNRPILHENFPHHQDEFHVFFAFFIARMMSARVFPVRKGPAGHTLRCPGRESMKNAGIHQNLFLILLSMCLTAALRVHAETKEQPLSAGTPSAPVSRAARLLLLIKAAALRTMPVCTGGAPAGHPARRTHFGPVKNGRRFPLLHGPNRPLSCTEPAG